MRHEIIKSDQSCKNVNHFNLLSKLATMKNIFIPFVVPPTFCMSIASIFLGLTMVQRGIKNNAYAKFWRDKQRVLWYF